MDVCVFSRKDQVLIRTRPHFECIICCIFLTGRWPHFGFGLAASDIIQVCLIFQVHTPDVFDSFQLKQLLSYYEYCVNCPRAHKAIRPYPSTVKPNGAQQSTPIALLSPLSALRSSLHAADLGLRFHLALSISPSTRKRQ